MTATATSSNAISTTKAWLNHVVVGLNFCPFAKKEVERNTIRYVLAPATAKDAMQCMLDELYHLDNHGEVETTLIILTDGFAEFTHYLDLVEHCDMLIDGAGYRGKYQLASFHPNYCFDGEPESAASNYTNRSPYPMLHLLREASLERVLNSYKNPQSIPSNNIEKANELGKKALADLLKNCAT